MKMEYSKMAESMAEKLIHLIQIEHWHQEVRQDHIKYMK